ncbi:hypothetical protein Q5P01_020464 [Channa striata]|uniref:Glutamate-rich protein 1 n=1 Tax=Channa striata TaxID=64152 RepID=A0AA88LYF9_CHASR|nr:hypothetical protein Q5P01_020464 [Channa striata]
MAHRKEVFQSKVLQRLYPAAPKQEKEPSPPQIVDALAKKTCVKRKASQQNSAGDAAQTQSAASPSSRVYTVLPPPADYMTHLEKSFTVSHLGSRSSAKDSAEDSVHESDEELNQDKDEEEKKRKRRRRKRKPTLCQDSGQDGAAPLCESTTGQSHSPVVEGGERISRNKKRKLKKKRHKEKLLSMGLMSRASALEFTFQKDWDNKEEEEEEDDEKRATEVSDFLRTMLDMCMSDSSIHVDKLPLLTRTVDDLLSRISSGRKPNSVLNLLYTLKIFVQQKDADKLEEALKELYNNSFMSAEETTAVSSLFRYWITDILPMQEDKTTGLSTTHS